MQTVDGGSLTGPVGPAMPGLDASFATAARATTTPQALAPSPSSAAAAPRDAEAARRMRRRRVFGFLIVVQMIGALNYAHAYYQLSWSGAASPLGLALGAPASLCLYVATAMFLLNPVRGKPMFLVAGVGLGLSTPLWGWSYLWTGVVAMGAALAIAGWCLARAEQAARVARAAPAAG